jgi:ribosomal protein L7/L12
MYYVNDPATPHTAISSLLASAIKELIERHHYNKIAAIKEFRSLQFSPLGLKEAKDIVEAVAFHYNVTFSLAYRAA